MQSESIKEIAAALAKAQAKIKGAIKDSSNPYFKSSYADLASVWDACNEQLTANGLSITQTMKLHEGDSEITETAEKKVVKKQKQLMLITTLLHASGEFIRSEYPIKPVKNDPQSHGSAITYARRYCLAAIAGVCALDDDDGGVATTGHTTISNKVLYDCANGKHKQKFSIIMSARLPYSKETEVTYKKINAALHGCKMEQLTIEINKHLDAYFRQQKEVKV